MIIVLLSNCHTWFKITCKLDNQINETTESKHSVIYLLWWTFVVSSEENISSQSCQYWDVYLELVRLLHWRYQSQTMSTHSGTHFINITDRSELFTNTKTEMQPVLCLVLEVGMFHSILVECHQSLSLTQHLHSCQNITFTQCTYFIQWTMDRPLTHKLYWEIIFWIIKNQISFRRILL